MKVTIKDIAAVAGVSYSTVSKALNNSPLVQEKTKRKIIKLSQEMGYKPNFAARSLVSNQTMVIGLIWPTIDRIVLSTLVTKISNEIRNTDYSMVLSVDPVETSIETFKRFQVDGIILFEENISNPIETESLPILSYGVINDARKNYPTIDPNYEEAMNKAVKYLFGLGHTKIAYISNLSSPDPMQIEKNRSFRKAMQLHGLSIKDEYIIDTEGFNFYDGYTATSKLLNLHDRPTAIVGGSYDLSSGIIRAISEKKLSIPKDISVISYDNIPEMENTEVPLTCIGVSIDQLATEIVHSMIKFVENNVISNPKQFNKKMSPVLVERESCGTPS
ncbi:LacI family DNA-binding transcriptional regulator [Oceanobacillus alkalisoli]|uniref:LacI family DNA-binding transcriptional regulator n=1 Tax=Oceanobacillus alkalisoli TaxID=2925113 RepID=UPI001EF1371D|nr:LacI family DNA-binding transcriptional regulator [Oceanobacillus alkalisoli]MCF3943935.1 LacI family transcriptional regulator [Oceanobacillus alkalisoli]MCG5104559.1 LacI family transcriptional regulator [Oceanobacillus alkalisoli]